MRSVRRELRLSATNLFEGSRGPQADDQCSTEDQYQEGRANQDLRDDQRALNPLDLPDALAGDQPTRSRPCRLKSKRGVASVERDRPGSPAVLRKCGCARCQCRHRARRRHLPYERWRIIDVLIAVRRR